MAQTISAQASPEKRLFISLLTRDIPLVAAFLDLVDNSINAAVEPLAGRLETAAGYLQVSQDDSLNPDVSIEIQVSGEQVSIVDDAGGISAEIAAEHVFRFGRSDHEFHEDDRLSVYGIGLKRAMFKLGNKIVMRSDHVDGGFDLELDVAAWAKDKAFPWTFEITQRPPAELEDCGTSITVTELYPDVTRRIQDGVFEGQLRDAMSRTYAFYTAKFVEISVNGVVIEGTSVTIGGNHSSETLEYGNVTCAITAGLGTPEAGVYRDKSSGWFVFCNGRAVIAADKTGLTGWGGAGLPIFQPKHRPFLGTVYFVSKNAELLPWTTTKSAINEDSMVWQMAKRQMSSLGRLVVTYLDGRYTDEGSETAAVDLKEASGSANVSVLSAAVSEKRVFTVPAKPPASATTQIQYQAKVKDVKRIAAHLKRSSMSGSEIGRHTFDYFLRNEVDE